MKHSYLSKLSATVLVALLGFSALTASRAAQQPYSLLINSNGGLLFPTNWFSAMATNSNFQTNSATVVSNIIWGSIVTMSNQAHLSASNATYAASSNLLVAATNNTLLTATNFAATATNQGWLTASNFVVTATNSALLTATNFAATATNQGWLTASNFVVTATNALNTGLQSQLTGIAWSNSTDYLLNVPAYVNVEAQRLAATYTRRIAAGSSNVINMTSNRQASAIAAGLGYAFNQLGLTNFVDAAFFGDGRQLTGGTNWITVRGRVGGLVSTTNTFFGLYFPGANSCHAILAGLPETVTNTVAIRFSAATNNSTKQIYQLVNSSGSATSCVSSIKGDGNNYYYYNTTNFTGTASAEIGSGIFARGLSGQPGAGLIQGSGPKNVISILDPANLTNVSVWVNGKLNVQFTNQVTYPQGANRLYLGANSSLGNSHKGWIQQIWIFDRAMTSNEVVQLNYAMDIVTQPIPVTVIGDSLFEHSYTTGFQERNVPTGVVNSSGAWSNYISLENHATSGQLASTEISWFPKSWWLSTPWLVCRQSPIHIVCIGRNDIGSGGASGATAFTAISNVWWMSQSNGATVIACTIPPWGYAYSTYTDAKASNLTWVNARIRDAWTNNPSRPFQRMWDIASIVDTNGLYDGQHPTNSEVASWINFVVTNDPNWMINR